MADFHPRCPKCDQPMDRGHIPELKDGPVRLTSWAPGQPVPQRWFWGGIKYNAKETIPLDAYRCPSCGYVELYARPA